MTTAVFDTLKAARDLKTAGIDETHAEAIVSTVARAFEDTVATKADLAEVKAAITGDIARLEIRLTRQLYAVAVGIVTLTVALIKLL